VWGRRVDIIFASSAPDILIGDPILLFEARFENWLWYCWTAISHASGTACSLIDEKLLKSWKKAPEMEAAVLPRSY